MKRLLVLLACGLAAHVHALPRLLDDAPRAASRISLGAADVEATPPGISFGEHFGKTSVIGVVSVAGTAALAAGIGSLGISLFGGPLLSILLNAFIPPVITVLLAHFMGERSAPGRFGFWLPLLGAFAVNAGAFLLSSFVIGVSWLNPAGILAYSLVVGLLMSFTSTGLMHLTQTRVAAPTVTSFVPGVTDTQVLSIAKVSL